MSYDLPNQLKWRKFYAAVRALGYTEGKSGGGSARNFLLKSKNKKYPQLPELLTVHKPHGKTPIKPGTLSSYINKLNLEHNEFLNILNGIQDEDSIEELPPQFLRKELPDGKKVSHCEVCLNPVIIAASDAEILAAEFRHRCPSTQNTAENSPDAAGPSPISN